MFAMTDLFAFKYNKYSLNQKEKLAKLCLKYKLEADSSKEKHWDLKRKKFVSTICKLCNCSVDLAIFRPYDEGRAC